MDGQPFVMFDDTISPYPPPGFCPHPDLDEDGRCTSCDRLPS